MVRLLRRPKRGAVLAAGLAAALLGGPALAAHVSGSSPGPSPAAAKAATTVVQTRTAAAAAAAVRTAGPDRAAVLLAYPAAVAAYPGTAPALAAAAQSAGSMSPTAVRPTTVPRTVRLTAALTPAKPAAPAGSICSVPGIGDIGGLLGFCNEGSSGVPGAINNICQPSLPDPEPASSGINSMIRPPAGTGPPAKTLYNNYGVAGQSGRPPA